MRSVIVIILIISFLPGRSQTATMQKADQLFQSGEWKKALAEYQQEIKATPNNGMALFKIGKCYFSLHDYKNSLLYYKKAYAVGQRLSIMLNMAEAFVKLNRKDSALHYLQLMATNGFPNPAVVESDSLLAGLRKDPAFKTIVRQLRINGAPCTGSPEYRQFDFWIGDWNVTSAGQPAGTSSIKLMLDSCVIYENWKGMKEGKSFNMYDIANKTWKQTWVDYAGTWLEYVEGSYQEGKMVFYTASKRQPNGTMQKNRLSFFNLDKDHVRQLAEQSPDDGKTWTVTYDFLYTRTN